MENRDLKALRLQDLSAYLNNNGYDSRHRPTSRHDSLYVYFPFTNSYVILKMNDEVSIEPVDVYAHSAEWNTLRTKCNAFLASLDRADAWMPEEKLLERS